VPEPINAHRLIWHPGAGLLTAQGHPAGAGSLAGSKALPSYVAGMTEALRRFGIEVPEEVPRFEYSKDGFEGIGRLDLTVDLELDSTVAGLAIMGGLASIQPSGRLQQVVTRQKGGRAIETVTWRGRSGIVARMYDKSVEARSGARATRLRFEAQQQWKKGHRRDVDELDAEYLRRMFHSRFVPFWRAAKGVHVVTTTKAAHRVREAVTAEEITAGQGVDVLGYLVAAQADVRLGDRTTQYRHRCLAQRLGLVLVDGELVEEEVEIDLHDVLEQVCDGEHWQG
jgi:hypothetical protein